VSSRLSPLEQDLVVRDLATRSWTTPDGSERTYSRSTIDRWILDCRRDGLVGLAPAPRRDKGRGRVNAELMTKAVALRREVPSRSAAQIA
jgi:hypothetical protein